MAALFDEVQKDAERTGSKYRDICRCRDDLLGFLDRNAWFGQVPEGTGRETAVPDYECMRDEICLWLAGYQKSPREKMELLLGQFRDSLPETCALYQEFAEKEGIADKPGGWKILDFILSSCDRELRLYSQAELDHVMEETKERLPVGSARVLAKFISEEIRDGQYCYEIHSRRQKELKKDAYSLRDFSIMAYCVFNPDSWEENRLVEKALSSRKNANLWLFTALHFFGAIRQSDLVRFPVPSLPCPKKELKARIEDGTYRDEDARGVSEELVLRMKYQPMHPSKTSRYRGIPELKFYLPESMKTAMGWILSIRLIHHRDGEPLVEPVQDLVSGKRFFGEAFADALGNRRFQTRRANKAYMQGIELVTEDVPGRPKGYMLAALARSHKGGIGSLPEMTDIYLKDAAFSGYKPEFILREMFERGIFGFIPAVMLERYAGEGYRKLDVSRQTDLIRSLGMDALQIEEVALLVETALERSREVVADIPADGLGIALQRIASGAAASRQKETLCLRIAAGLPCADALRGGCIGCGYEVYTKAAFHLLIKEYVRVSRLKKDARGTEKIRMQNLLLQGILPAVGEMVSSLPLLYPGAETGMLLEMMERGMRDADGGRITGY